MHGAKVKIDYLLLHIQFYLLSTLNTLHFRNELGPSVSYSG